MQWRWLPLTNSFSINYSIHWSSLSLSRTLSLFLSILTLFLVLFLFSHRVLFMHPVYIQDGRNNFSLEYNDDCNWDVFTTAQKTEISKVSHTHISWTWNWIKLNILFVDPFALTGHNHKSTFFKRQFRILVRFFFC